MEGASAFQPIDLPPGFRFHPTDEELITHYLSPKVVDPNFISSIIGEVDLNKVEPWDLPWKAKMGEKEWYFLCMKDRKYPSGSRTNRATDAGYWKATGKDKEIYGSKILVGMKKTLVFYRGRAPRGVKTNWVMHEFRLQGKKHPMHSNAFRTDDKNEWVICRIFMKGSGGTKVPMSCLERNRDYGSNMPPLTELSSDENQVKLTEESQATSFSNAVENLRDISVDEFSSSSKNSNFMYIFSQAPNQNIGNADMSSSICDHQMELKPYSDDQDFPMTVNGHVDFDHLWDY